MKKIIHLLVTALLLCGIFVSCGLIDIDDYEVFNLDEETVIKVDERLFLNGRNFFIKLNRIIDDTRAPSHIVTDQSQYVKMEFQIGKVDSIGILTWNEKVIIQTDTLNTIPFLVPFDANVGGGIQYFLTVTDVQPEPLTLDQNITSDSYRVTFMLEEGDLARKPNIYLYPKYKTKMDVSLMMPEGGCICESDPQYPDQWQNIKVRPSGLINNEYEYLFYEAILPDRWQYDTGWSVKKNDLTAFFRANLAQYGFVDHEIDDFIDYWIPILQEHPYYNIYPQYTAKIDEMVVLNISKKPESVLRLFYVIVAAPEKEDIPIPTIPAFDAKGFVVREWGVILK